MIDRSSNNKKWFFFPLLFFIVFRVFILILLYFLTKGSEFTSDLWVFRLGLDPLSVITFGTSVSSYSQPPLFPIALAIPASLLSLVTNEFIASRISFSIFELSMFLAVFLFLSRTRAINYRAKFSILTILAFSPLGFMTGLVMRQEEAIVAFFMALVMLVVGSKNIKVASLLVLVGILTSKILFGVVFIALLMIAPKRREVMVWGIIPSIIVVALYSIIGYFKTGVVPFLEFAPSDVPFCASTFRLALYCCPLSGFFMKWVSLGMMGAAFLCLLPLSRKMNISDFPLAMLLVLCILFLLFYHINTEYHIFALPFLAVVPYLPQFKFPKITFNMLHFLLGISTWSYGIVYGIRAYSDGKATGSYSKEVILKVYNKYLGFIPLKVLEIGLLIATLLVIAVIMSVLIWSINRRTTKGMAVDPPLSLAK